jgi:hypothetical protein
VSEKPPIHRASVEISCLAAPIPDAALDQLATVLVDCVDGGASVSFMAPFSQADALNFFRKGGGFGCVGRYRPACGDGR